MNPAPGREPLPRTALAVAPLEDQPTRRRRERVKNEAVLVDSASVHTPFPGKAGSRDRSNS